MEAIEITKEMLSDVANTETCNKMKLSDITCDVKFISV